MISANHVRSFLLMIVLSCLLTTTSEAMFVSIAVILKVDFFSDSNIMNEFSDAMLLAEEKKKATLMKQRESEYAKRHPMEILDRLNEHVGLRNFCDSSTEYNNVSPRSTLPLDTSDTVAEDDSDILYYDVHEEPVNLVDGDSNELCDDNDKESSIENCSSVVLNHPLHLYTDVACINFLSGFLRIVRSSNICKSQAQQFLSLIKSALPEPNNLPDTMAKLLRELDIDYDLFVKRVVCTCCKCDLVNINVTQCTNCNTNDGSTRALVYDGNIRVLLSTMIRRLRPSIEAYTSTIKTTHNTTRNTDIPFGRIYQSFLKENKSRKVINLLLHLDGENSHNLWN
jgi:hypothetical protein